MNIDPHDDLCEAYFRSLGNAEPPTMMKEASWKERTDLLDRDFAVILVDGEGKEHRKFACHDAGNAAMSLWYLENVDHGLPSNAAKVAEHNIKIAMGEKHNLEIDDSFEGRGYVLDERRVKVAMSPLPASSPARMQMTPSAKTGQGVATSMIGGRPSMGMASPMPKNVPKGSGFGGTRPPMGPGGMSMGKTVAASASPYDILAYAQNEWNDIDPYDRHDIAVYLCKEGSAAGVVVPDHIHLYGGETLNPHFGAIMEHRKKYASRKAVQENYDDLAKMAAVMEPMEVVATLFLIDEQASLTPRYGTNIPDPLLSVFGQEKEAEYSWIHGTDMVNAKQLKKLAATRSGEYNLGELFNEGFQAKFRADPVSVFEGAPLEQKIILSRLATQSGYSNDGGHFS